MTHSKEHAGGWSGGKRISARASAVLLIALAVLIGACSRRGDFGAFFVQEVSKYGGRVDTTAGVPKVQARWTLKENENGFEAYVTGATWSEVDAVVRAVRGKRARSSPERVYGEADTGVGVTLHWIFIKGRTEVICTRGEAP